MSAQSAYLKGSQHPWPCFLFVLPLLVLYEVSVLRLGGANQESLRNGADYWVRCGLQRIGLKWFWVPPTLLILFFVVWIIRRRKDWPGDLIGLLSGMGIESVAFALGLWGLSRVLAPLMHALGTPLAVTSDPDHSLKRLIPYLGAGIYEEALFRLFLYTILLGLLHKLEVHAALGCFLAALGSASLFCAAHYVGPFGQNPTPYDVLFRLLAGVYFALLFHHRGFGIAVGTHACYNVMVTVGSL